MSPLPVGLMEYVIGQVRAIHSIPAPTFSEQKRAEYVMGELKALGFQQAHIDQTGNALACWPGGKEKKVVVSAHLDTVHPEKAVKPLLQIEGGFRGPGVGDNTLGVAALLGLGWDLAYHRYAYPGDLWLAGNIGEEGLGNLVGMNAIVERFGGEAHTFLVLEGLGLGQVCHRGLGVARFRISAETSGGHSWVDYGKPSAIHELAGVITSITGGLVPSKPRSCLNVGVIQGGTSVNTIAAQAWCELDLRSEDQLNLEKLIKRVRRMVVSKESPGVKISMESIGSRPAGGIPSSHRLVKLALDILADLGVVSCLETGSTDANVPLSQGIPAICIGITHGGNPHTGNEFIQLEPIRQGMEQLSRLVSGVWSLKWDH